MACQLAEEVNLNCGEKGHTAEKALFVLTGD